MDVNILLMDYYQIKEKKYFTKVRNDILPYIPVNKKLKFLDIGCGGGDTLIYLKNKQLIKEACGVELFDLADSSQQSELIDKMIIGDVQKKNLDLPQNYFDIILCADVLEHLTDPWDTLQYIRNFLADGGTLIVSIPNIREFSSLYKIFFKGDFAYASSGILDKTHLRFFCKKNIQQLVTGAGFEIEKSLPSFKTCPLQKRRKWFSKISFGLVDQILAQQYIVTAKKKNEEK